MRSFVYLARDAMFLSAGTPRQEAPVAVATRGPAVDQGLTALRFESRKDPRPGRRGYDSVTSLRRATMMVSLVGAVMVLLRRRGKPTSKLPGKGRGFQRGVLAFPEVSAHDWRSSDI